MLHRHPQPLTWRAKISSNWSMKISKAKRPTASQSPSAAICSMLSGAVRSQPSSDVRQLQDGNLAASSLASDSIGPPDNSPGLKLTTDQAALPGNIAFGQRGQQSGIDE